jgi:prepilin-type N-terminal cleavage/methylation domain-containing protein
MPVSWKKKEEARGNKEEGSPASFFLLPFSFSARRAFTYVELIMTLALLAVLVAMAAPRFAEATARYQAESAARRIAADLALARSEARLAGSSRAVIFDNLQYRMPGVASLDRKPGDYRVNLEATPYRVHALTAQLGGDATVIFDPYGVPDSAGTITVRVGRWTRTISIDAQTARVGVQ